MPSSWKGSGISDRKDGTQPYQDFKESDIRYLSENGMNFARIFFNFETLRYPDYPQDQTQISKKQLEDLDQLIAWGIEYGVHIQISSRNFFTTNDLSKVSAADWKNFAAYWSMLARRYAGIPSTYLSFDLDNEDQPSGNMTVALQGIKEVRDDILKADPNRVLLYSYQGNSSLKWVDAVTSLGIAIGIHPYYPNILTSIDNPYTQVNGLVGQPQWPFVWFPGGKISNGQAPLILKGAISGGQVELSCESYSKGANVTVYINGELYKTVAASGGQLNGGQYQCQGQPGVTIDIPEDAKEIKIFSHIGIVDSVVYKNASIEVHMDTIDAADYQDFSDPLPLIINADGTYTNSENKVITADTIYDLKIQPMIDIAQKYNVGYMVNEFGSYCVEVPYQAELIARFTDDLIAMFEKHQIGWSFAEMQGAFSRFLVSPSGNFDWVGTQTKEILYNFSDGHFEVFFENQNLMNVIRKYTLPK